MNNSRNDKKNLNLKPKCLDHKETVVQSWNMTLLKKVKIRHWEVELEDWVLDAKPSYTVKPFLIKIK